jgi:hypothetical protein
MDALIALTSNCVSRAGICLTAFGGNGTKPGLEARISTADRQPSSADAEVRWAGEDATREERTVNTVAEGSAGSNYRTLRWVVSQIEPHASVIVSEEWRRPRCMHRSIMFTAPD